MKRDPLPQEGSDQASSGPQIAIAGEPANLSVVTFRRRGLGPRKDFPRTPFVLEADYAEFCARFSPHIEDLREELLADDLQTGQFDPAYEGASSHPDFEEFLALPESARLQLVNTFLAEEILALWFVEESPDPGCRWLTVNAITGLRFTESLVHVEGETVPLVPEA